MAPSPWWVQNKWQDTKVSEKKIWLNVGELQEKKPQRWDKLLQLVMSSLALGESKCWLSDSSLEVIEEIETALIAFKFPSE